MATEKLDYKKEYKDLYMPKKKPMLIDVPNMGFLVVDGTGAPEGGEYKNALQALYALTFTIKMSKMGGTQPKGYFEYVVPPLEGLWYGEKGAFERNRRDEWRWRAMIRQPEFVTREVFEWAVDRCAEKKPEVDVSRARFEEFTEGLCVQMMHVGPYSQEPASIAMLHEFMEQNALRNMTGNVRKHHEIYLSDPRKTAPDKMKTVLRLPVEKA